MLQILREARDRGLDVTTEMYPYIAGCTRIESSSFDDWMDRPESAYHNLQWVATGERLTRETFLKYRKQGGNVITFTNTEDMVEYCVKDPLPMIASDGFGFETGTSHPRSAGTFSRILGVYVREKKLMTIPEATPQDDARSGTAAGGARPGDEEERPDSGERGRRYHYLRPGDGARSFDIRKGKSGLRGHPLCARRRNARSCRMAS